MAKPMGLTIQVEEGAFGRVFNVLDAMQGVISIKIEASGPKPKGAAKTPGQKKGGAQSAPCLVLGALMKVGTKATPSKWLNREELAAVIVAGGKKATSLPDTLQKLRNAKEVVNHGTGRDVRYRITEAGVKRFKTACTIQPVTEK